ncbi:MAG: hypothetical protein NUV77_25180 [Thermoguttaceae bacterium]|jgi:hypothetical protein|nr:hypothetical protein [Thermoguttaceae bacterium]
MSATRRAAEGCSALTPRIRWGRAALAFAATVAIAVALGKTRDSTDGANGARHFNQVWHTAVAQVSWTAHESGLSVAPGEPWAKRERIRQRLVSDEFLTKARQRASGGQGEGGTPSWPSAEELRSGLDVSVRTDRAGQIDVTLAYSATDGAQAACVVNSLAEQAREERQLAVEADARRSRESARAATEQAREDYHRARTELARFLERHFAEHQAASEDDTPTADAAAMANKTPPATSSTSKTPASPVQNPEWIELNREVAQARERLAILRLDRTSAHPAVQEMERRFEELERRLSTVPRELPQVGGGNLTPDAPKQPANEAPKPASRPANPVRRSVDHAESLAVYRRHQEALDRAERNLQQAEAAELATWERTAATPWVVVRLAHTTHPAPTGGPTPGFLLTVLAAGLTVAAGVLMVSAGADLDPPLASVEEVQAQLPVPVVGSLRVACAALRSAPRRRLATERLGWMASGSALILGCIALLWYTL